MDGLPLAQAEALSYLDAPSSSDDDIEEGETERKPRSSRHRKSKRSSTQNSSPHRSSRSDKHRSSASGSPSSPSRSSKRDSPSRTSKREIEDREAKRRARSSKSSDALSPGAQSQDDLDREAKRRARSSSALSPGAVSSMGGHKSREKAKGRSTSRDSIEDSERPVLPGAVSSTGEHKSRDKARRRRSNEEAIDGSHRSSVDGSRRSSVDDSDRRTKDRARRSRGSTVTPGAVSSSSRDDRAARKSSRKDQSPMRSSSKTQDQDEVAKRRAKHGRSVAASVPGAVSGGPGDSQSAKAKSKAGGGGGELFDNSEMMTAPNGEGEFAVTAEMVDDNEDEDAKIQRMVDARLQAQQNAGNNNNGDMDTMGLDPQSQRNKQQGLASKRICILVTAFLLIGGGIVGVLFGIGVLGKKEEAVVQETTSPTVTSSNAPTTTAPTTAMPSGSPTYFVYPRPNLDDCQLIESGQELPDQTVYDRNYALSLEIEMDIDTNPELLYETLTTQIQKNIMPKLAGCDSAIQRRQLESEHDPLKFWIRNGLVITLNDAGECETNNSAVSCFKVELDVSIYVFDEESRNLYLIGRISRAFEGNLLEELGLGAPFTDIRFTSLRNLDPTLQPSVAPSMNPSQAPSSAPSAVASSRPSMAPVDYPTTRVPTKTPTFVPTGKAPAPTTPAPTKAPTPPPTPFPTAMPAPGVTPRPTISPSETPSDIPSSAPSETPSDIPSSVPSETPSGIPSFVPSSLPTSGPTSTPTNRPTEVPTSHPTDEPTNTPTAGPSKVPTDQPTRSPTKRPTSAPQPWPTPPPTPYDRAADIQNRLQQYGISPINSNALNWMVNTDTFIASSTAQWVDRYGMVVFYQKAGQSAWLQSGINVCSWEKVTCDSNGRVGQLNLRNWGSTTVPTELGILTTLTSMEFQNDRVAVNGKIPSSITQLTNLRHLFMRASGLTSVGAEILQMTSLTSLNFRDESFRSTLPTQIYQLTNLVNLYIKQSALQGTIPAAIGQLTRLTSLDVSTNSLQKPFPQALTQTPIRKIIAGQNPWSSTIPAWFGQMTNLEILFLASSGLNGAIPTQIANLTRLTSLNFRYNSLGGNIPPLPTALSTSTGCDLRNNNFLSTTNRGTCSV